MSSPAIDLKISPRARAADSKPKPLSPLARGPSPRLASSPSPPEKKHEDASQSADSESAFAGIIDMETFRQILDLDEDGTNEFSKGMAWAYFSQAVSTFEKMDDALANKDLEMLSSLGHFLKGSSAALGVSRVQDICEKIQHLGKLRDQENDKSLTSEMALSTIKALLVRVKDEYNIAEKCLKGLIDGPDEATD